MKTEFLYSAKNALDGSKEDQYILACHYLIGEHVQRDIKEAEEWLNKAALQEHSKAQLILGDLMIRQKKFNEAFYWLSKALQNGCTQAKKILDILEKEEVKEVSYLH